jgi:hypothetical protein
MSTTIIRISCYVAIVLGLASCTSKKESVDEIRNGAFKIDIRSQEFNNSGVINIDICVAETSALEFPKGNLQCLLHGYDFDGLKAKWISPREIEISIDCGEVSVFSNYATVLKTEMDPVEFHAVLRDNANCHSSGIGHS